MADALGIHVHSNAMELIRYFDSRATYGPEAAKAATIKTAYLVRADIAQSVNRSGGSGTHWPSLPHPSSAPGEPPAKQSGDYADSWQVHIEHDLLDTIAVVGTDEDQGWRLEKGFVGTDRLGRTYAQAPRPHVDPALERQLPKWLDPLDTLLVVS